MSQFFIFVVIFWIWCHFDDTKKVNDELDDIKKFINSEEFKKQRDAYYKKKREQEAIHRDN